MVSFGNVIIFLLEGEERLMKARILAALLLLVLTIGGLSGCISSNKRFAYVTGTGTNEVFQFQVHSNGSLTPLNPANAAVGSSPSSVAVRPAGDFVYITNFAGNNLTLLAVNKGNGQLTVPVNTNPIPAPTPPNIFNTGTGPIAVVADPAAPFLFVLDQGSSDVISFTIDPATGNLTVVNTLALTSPITHPTSMAVSPKGDLLLVVDQAAGSLAVISVSSKGVLNGGPVSLGATAPSSVVIEPTGRFFYVTDKTKNQVLGFSIPSGGALTQVSGSPFATGSAPVSVAANSAGTFLYIANQGSNDVSAFLIDSSTGALAAISGSPVATGGRGPTLVTASGSFVYVTEQITNDIAAFTIASNGGLSAVPGSPFNVAAPAQWIALSKE
jgi:6-phosphogluconolactonase